MRKLFIIISIILFTNYALAAGPILKWKLGSSSGIETICDTPSNCQDPVSQSLKDEVDDLATADLIYNPDTKYTIYGGPPYTIGYYTDVHDYFRTQNADILIIPYGNPRNYAGNIFHKNQISYNHEEYYLHIPLAGVDDDERLVPSWWDPVNNCAEATHNEWVYYMGDADFMDFFTGEMATIMADGNKFDGIFLDNAGVEDTVWKINRCDEVETKIPPINPLTTNNYTEAEQHTEHDNFIDEIVADLTTSNPDGNWLDEDMLFPINTGHCLVADEKTMITAMSAGTDILGGGLFEGSGVFAHQGVKSSGYKDCTDGSWITTQTQYTVAAWKQQVDDLKWLMDNNHMAMILAKEMRKDHNNDSIVNSEDWIAYPNSKMMFIYGSTLLAAGATGDKCYFKYGLGNSMADWQGLDQDIGVADGDYFLWSGSTAIYARWFTKGLALVNPSDTDETVNPGFNYQRFIDGTINSLNWTGLGSETSGNIQIDAYSAEILYGQPNKITNPYPISTGVPITADLTWTNPVSAVTVDVYYDQDEVSCPPGSPTKVVNAQDVETYVIPGDMGYNEKSCWRVDVKPTGDLVTGEDKEFTTQGFPPTKASGKYSIGGAPFKYEVGGAPIK